MNDIERLDLATTEKTYNNLNDINHEKLRCRLRQAKFMHRDKERELLKSQLRFVEEVPDLENVSTEELKKLAKKLKKKNQTSSEVLLAITNALLIKAENIDTFLSIDGVLQGLLRCLTAQNEMFQLMAARCICNLALGSEKSVFQVLKASDSYLLAHLSGKNQYVKEACVCALGNFCRHGAKHIQLLLVQGFFPKIPELLINADEILELSCVYCLNQMVYHGFDFLRDEDLLCTLKFVIPLFQKNCTLVIFLLSLLSAHKCCLQILNLNNIHVQVLQKFLLSLENKKKDAIFYLRVVSNCFSQNSGEMAIELVQKYNSLLKKCIKYSLESDLNYLKKESLAFLGILINHSFDIIVEFGLIVLRENLEVAKFYMKSNQLNEMNNMII